MPNAPIDNIKVGAKYSMLQSDRVFIVSPSIANACDIMPIKIIFIGWSRCNNIRLIILNSAIVTILPAKNNEKVKSDTPNHC